MRQRDYLVSLMLNRVVWLVPEIVVILGFGALAFGVAVRGSWGALTAVIAARRARVLGARPADREPREDDRGRVAAS